MANSFNYAWRAWNVFNLWDTLPSRAIIEMADLKKMFESAGLENVERYIQSGNVLFESEADDFAFKGCEMYNLGRDEEKSIFTGNSAQKIFKLPIATRNLNAIFKILEKYK